MVLGDILYDSCDLDLLNINEDGTVGGDVFDIRQATTIKSVSFINNTIAQGMRTFVRLDPNVTVGALTFENNTLFNLCFVDNANNAGIFGLQVKPGSFSFKNNLFLNMTGKSVLAGANAKYIPASDLGVSASNNWFFDRADCSISWPVPISPARRWALPSGGLPMWRSLRTLP